MPIRYGRKNCKHEFVFRKDGYEEYCSPVVCIKCGAFGCECDIEKTSRPSPSLSKKNGVNGNANTNGKWKNPYVNP